MAIPVNPKYPLFLRDIDKNNGSCEFSTVIVEDNFNIDAKSGVFYDIKNKQNDEVNINLEDNNNNQFLINCPCTLSFNKDIDWVELDEPNLLVPIKILITVVNNIAKYKPIIDEDVLNNKNFGYCFKFIDNVPNMDTYIQNIELGLKDELYTQTYYKCYGNLGVCFGDYFNRYDTLNSNNNLINTDDFNITEIILGNNIHKILTYSFNTLRRLSKINISENIKYIGNRDYVFSDDSYVQDNLFQKDALGIKYINNWLIDGSNVNISKVIIKDVVGIAEQAFIDINIDELIIINVKYINNYAFNSCGLTDVNLGEGLLEIGDMAFFNNNIINMTFPTTLEYLGENALGTYIPNDENTESTDYGDFIYLGKVLYDITNIRKENFVIKDGTTQIYDNASISTTNNKEDVKSIQLPNSLKRIEKYALSGFTSIEHITIPDSVEYINSSAFVYCTSLKTITTAKGTYNVGEYDTMIELANGTFVTIYIDEEMYECVLPETEILIDNQGNTKQIKDLQIGDTVITNKNNNLIETTINKLVQVQHNSYLKVTLENNDILNISLDHNICTKDGWKCYNNITTKNKECVGKLTIGDEVLTTNGFVKITSIEMINKENTIMYNIGVKEGNNYYANGICVYECDK